MDVSQPLAKDNGTIPVIGPITKKYCSADWFDRSKIWASHHDRRIQIPCPGPRFSGANLKEVWSCRCRLVIDIPEEPEVSNDKAAVGGANPAMSPLGINARQQFPPKTKVLLPKSGVCSSLSQYGIQPRLCWRNRRGPRMGQRSSICRQPQIPSLDRLHTRHRQNWTPPAARCHSWSNHCVWRKRQVRVSGHSHLPSSLCMFR